MSKALFIFLLINIQTSFIISDTLKQDRIIELKKGVSQTFEIKYKNETNLFLNITEQDDDTYQANIHSINCNLKVDFKGEIRNKINLDTFTLMMDKTNNNIIITPLIDVIDGIDKENYDYKSCPISIDIISMNKSQLNIENKEDSFIYFNPPNLNSLNISYEIKNEITNDTFISIFFQFNERANFAINVTNELNKKLIQKNVSNSTYIFLNNEFLQDDNQTNKSLSINIKYMDIKNINLRFKVVEKGMISIIQKNALNYGFLTSKALFQYYYMEVFKDEEGEIMLHNKRIYGLLYARIIEKNKINENQLNDPYIYPNETVNGTDSTYFDYNPHSLQLKFTHINTSICFNGCYILITFQRKTADNISDENSFPLIGYEFTLLSRNWNYSDDISQIIDIPFNEYIIGSFQKGSINHHYYAISKPDDADKIIIQIEGNYIEGYFEEGRKKINTFIIEDNKQLDIIKNQNVLTLNLKELNLTDKTISFAFRPKDYFVDIFSFYYFRILYLKEKETIYFPMDSQFGNLFSQEKNETSPNTYYCYAIFFNNYNEFDNRFGISSSNQNEYFIIEIIQIYKNGSQNSITREFNYFTENSTKDTEHYIFKFIYNNDQIKNIMSAFNSRVNNTYPQIYSAQMFYISRCWIQNNFRLKYNYTLTNKYIHGTFGWERVSFLSYENFYSNRNFKGKPFSIPVDSQTTHILFTTFYEYYLHFFQLTYNMKNKAVEEIKSGESIIEIKYGDYFPLYYYLKIKDDYYANVDIYLRLNSYNDSLLQNVFYIKGYMVDEDTIRRKINGEYINLNNPIDGYYSDIFKVGLLQINQPIESNNKYILITITNNQIMNKNM